MSANTHDEAFSGGNLGLGSVLVGSLPAGLMTEDPPARYTVEAVFTRRPGKEEIRAILGGSTRELLEHSGYSDVELTVSDRRLEIHNTTLEELRDGLAELVALRLAEISERVRSEKEASDDSARTFAARELDRAAAVAALAETVVFTAPPVEGDAARQRAEAYRVQIEGWSAVGGSVSR
ncbi:MAG: hypothetical protein K0S70_3517 [Microbacterium sp.]|jgi:hypothetical protein|nr:hypothetical protein [Microbacterium sp.]